LSFSAGSQSWVSVSDPLFELLAHSTYISKLTDYRFDITMGSLTHLWRENTQKNIVPSKREIRKQLRNVGAQNIWLDSLNGKVQLSKKGMQLDLGGIAKGYMGDQLAGFLKRRQIQSFLIDMGGDLIAGDAPPGKEGWQIKVPYLDTILTVSNIAIATSGPDYQFFDYKGKRYTHILDPDTGWGISKPYSSTILAKEGYLADALASAFILMQTEDCEEIGHIFPEMTYFLWKDDQIHQGNDHYHTE
jgi:thiamine biosynthesis lipoprotein